MSMLNFELHATSVAVKCLSFDEHGRVNVELSFLDADTFLVGFPAVLRPGESFELSGVKVIVPFTDPPFKSLVEISISKPLPNSGESPCSSQVASSQNS